MRKRTFAVRAAVAGALYVAILTGVSAAGSAPVVSDPGSETADTTVRASSVVSDPVARAADATIPRSADSQRGFAQRAMVAFDADYGGTTAPAAIVPGGVAPVEVRVTNVGYEKWATGGDDPIRLSYHWYDGNGSVVVWDGPRADLSRDVAPGQVVTFLLNVQAPRAEGTFTLAFDLVQEQAGWWSGRNIAMERQQVAVDSDGVTFYGKGWGHGIGLSQWGAQGWAQGAAGVRLNGEQIVQKYFPGAQLSKQPAELPIRVLLSAPSTGCVSRTIQDVARMSSAGGMLLVDNDQPSKVYADVGPNSPLTFYADGPMIEVWSSRGFVLRGPGTVTLVPKQWWDPIAIAQKGLSYRGNLLVQSRDEGFLRVVNYVSSDDYMLGALPGEMPNYWEMEALRAQAIAARTYAAWRQSTAGDRTWDVRDDTADQCYGGRTFEGPRTTAAVASTASTILTYDGKPIRALYSSASGGISENVGCVLDAVKVGITWQCADGYPYMGVVPDPAELAARDIRGPNPQDTLWSKSFTGSEIRKQIIEDYGVDIGKYVSMEFNLSPGGRPISVRVRGTDRWVDLKGDRFLRTTLGLKSTLVRTIRF